jgi:hypothetical protein
VDELGKVRLQAMQVFLEDYDSGRRECRYIEAELPVLPFADRSFELIVCSHFLFLYSSQLSEKFHLESVSEMCRVASEVRIFPLLTLDGVPSRHLAGLLDRLREFWAASIETVQYEFQRGGNQMLRVKVPRK